jgi:hypothetical protein
MGFALLASPRPQAAPGLPSRTGALFTAAKATILNFASSLVSRAAGRGAACAPDTPNAKALDDATRKFAHDHPELLAHPAWDDVRAYLDQNSPPEAVSALQK